jgi:Tfp pilus assembly pilus retraction ATPase PilT
VTAALKAAFWDLVREARAAGALRIHLAPGAAPLGRLPDRTMVPLAATEPFDRAALETLWNVLVDPDEWNRLEQIGEGDVLVTAPEGVVQLALFRSEGTWTAVVRLA